MVQRWHYLHQIFEGHRMQEELDELGEAGWELITAHWEEYSYGGRTQLQARCILKRPATETDTDEGEYRVGWTPATAGII
jgi:hypothetical protein